MLATLGILGCGTGAGTGADAELLSVEQLKDPETCRDCHPNHYAQWRTSMHAYAAEDPVFHAMNRLGQKETGGELGDFCVGCHAPLAVADGLTSDGLNLDEVPDHAKGVTCYFCHNVEQVSGTHNNPLELAMDQTMRGGIADPLQPGVHRAAYSEIHDGAKLESAALCGACHDIVTPGHGVSLERTFQEWQDSIFSATTKAAGRSTCIDCPMDGRDAPAAEMEGLSVPVRKTHAHLWPGVDVALTEFPGVETQRRAIECFLSSVIMTRLEVDPLGGLDLWIEASAGHSFPSGAAQDRRAWVELLAYDDDDQVIFQTGVVGDDEVVDKPDDHPNHDPNLWIFRDRLYDVDGQPTHRFWEAAPSEAYPLGYESYLLPATSMQGGDHGRHRSYQIGIAPARVTVRVRIRPVGLEVLDELIELDHLDPEVRAQVPTHDIVGSQIEWRREDGYDTVVQNRPQPLDCDLECLSDPAACE